MKRVLFISILFLVQILSAEIMDYAAGYGDGCMSAKGDFSKSRFAYENIPSYKKGWLKGNQECKSTKSDKKRTQTDKKYKKSRHYSKRKNRKSRVKTKRYRTYRCRSNPWLTFNRGWNDGYRSAQGRWRKLSNRCSEYYRGWYEGYNHCKCFEIGECVKISSSIYQNAP
jgi:hypothetical protein